MLISELPTKLRELAELRREAHLKGSTQDIISNAFEFASSPEGGDFWWNIHHGHIPKEYLEDNYTIY